LDVSEHRGKLKKKMNEKRGEKNQAKTLWLENWMAFMALLYVRVTQAGMAGMCFFAAVIC
jgi:hypothetical protein